MANKKIVTLTEESIRLLASMLERERMAMRPNRSISQQPHVDAAPECYIALIPKDGIKGTSYYVSSGTGAGTGTVDVGGTSYADCDIFRIDMRKTSQPNITPVGIQRRVWNISQSYVYGPKLVPVNRDKFGQWVFTGEPRSTEFVKVLGPSSGGWYPGVTLDFSVTTGLFTAGDNIYIKESSGQTLAVNDVFLDAHLVGYLSGFRRYLVNKATGTTTLWAEIIDEPGPGTGTLPGTGALSDWYGAYLGTYVNCTWTPDTGTVVAVKSPNGYPLKIGSKGRVTYICTTGGYDRYLGEAEHWDFGNC